MEPVAGEGQWMAAWGTASQRNAGGAQGQDAMAKMAEKEKESGRREKKREEERRRGKKREEEGRRGKKREGVKP